MAADFIFVRGDIYVAKQVADNKLECMICMIDALLSGSLEATIIPEDELSAHILSHSESAEWKGWQFYKDFYSTGGSKE